MRISRLRLTGFKSFVEPTELIIESGLTGVVGPNGCGKSNLLEALRWVMGESSHKSMRAASMNDVIFSGTTTRPARNWAEVTMFLDNAHRTAPAQYNDDDTIEITRRIERDAGSAYRINSREARAKDIKILFEDAATGARSPALVRQGQIGDLVNAKPESRRRILEDAAGVAGLHSRRHDAELRLNAAERNLTRLDDVLGGLTSQIESLKRQARQARRYKDISAQIRRTQALAMHLSWTEAVNLRDTEEQALRQIVSALATAVEFEAQTLVHETELSETLQPLRDEEATRAALYGRLKVESENFEREVTRAKSRASELDERARQFELDLAREENFTRESAEIIARLETEIADNTAQNDAAQATTKSAKADTKQADEALSKSEANLSELTRRHAMEDARRASQKAALKETVETIGRIEHQLATTKTETSQISASAPDAQKHEQAQATVTQLTSDIADVETKTTAAEARIATLDPKLRSSRETASAARLSFNALKTERETLAKLLSPTQGTDCPAIVDALTVEPGYEIALGAALGDDLDAPAAVAADDAPVRWTLIDASARDAKLPPGATSLATFVQSPAELKRRLNQIGLIERSQGAKLQKNLKPGQRLVSLEGDLWRWDGFIAACEGTTPAALRLEQRNRMTALAHEEVELKEALDTLEGDEQDCLTQLTAARENESKLRASTREMHTRLAKSRDTLAVMERAARDTESKLAALGATQSRCDHDLTTARQKADTITAALEATSAADEEALNAALQQAQHDAQAARARAAQKHAVLTSLEREHQLRTQRLHIQKTEHDSWQSRATSAQQQIKTLQSRLEETQAELQTLKDLPAQMEARRTQLLESLEQADTDRKLAGDNVAKAETTLKSATTTLREAATAVSEAREQRAASLARQVAIRDRLDDDQRRIREALNIEPDECLALAELDADTQPPSLADVEQRLSRLKADRERLGGVNLQADDELGELADQHDSLEAERADVEQAIATLRTAIGGLNREAKKRLKEAFETVDGHFRRLFQILFDGGEARLEMIQSEEDPLEGGLEIIAKPPGKKPATLSLLSGGEQTLTALSLIFAVFLTNPSPICVLDEVDAPLDDANVDRFCTLMERMADDTETRFLVITHHPMTMTRMNRLFGVTMSEKGISQLVSVDLETAQGFREAS